MNGEVLHPKKDFMLFDLIMIFMFTVFTAVLLYAPQSGSMEMFIPLACLVLSMIATYNIGLQKGMITAVLLTFAYGTYVIYRAFSADGNIDVDAAHIMWMLFFPIGSMLAGNLSFVVGRYKLEMESKKNIEKLVSVDANTGFYKNQEFFKKMDEEFQRARRHKSNFAILIIQITNYHELQSIYGDVDMASIQKAIAEIIQQQVRNSDGKFTISNEMLSVLLTETDEAGARVVIEKLHMSLERVTVTIHGGVKKVVRVKPSIGFAALTDGDTDPLEIYDRAKSELAYDKG